MSTLSLLSESDLQAVREAYLSALAPQPDVLRNAGQQLLARMAPANWTLEWGLPLWLGCAFDLDPASARTMAVCNVFGLGYVRLQDDLLDESWEPGTKATKRCLGNLLYRQAMQRYARLFSQHTRFWDYLDQYMAQWLQATIQSNQPAKTDFHAFDDDDFALLAARGAPLKIGCAGVCLLAAQPAALPTLTQALEYWLTASVLLDHVHDWEADLAADRYNTFVAYASPLPQTSLYRTENRRGVLEMLYLGDQAQPYFDLIRRFTRLAAEVLQPLDCPPLHRYLQIFENRALAYGMGLARQAKRQLREATEQFFGPAVTQ